MLSSAGFILLFPLLALRVKNPGRFFKNILSVLSGKKSWVGYAAMPNSLPQIRPGVLPPYNILEGYVPDEKLQQELDTAYAEKYTANTDVGLILKNFKYLGGF